MIVPEAPRQSLSREEIDAFWRDGAICVRQLYSQDWVKRIEDFIDDIVSRPSPIYGPRDPGGTISHDGNSWLVNDAVRDFVFNAPSVHIAQQVFEAKRVTFFYDQIFVKERLSPEPTPWHHDFTFWPISGRQIASLWTSVDPVDASSSALEFVAGSHLWPQRFRAIGIGGFDVSTGQGLEELPDIDADRSAYDILCWDLEPGDALLFHALTLHGSRGNRSKAKKRRAIATRWCGDDVVYDPVRESNLYDHGLKPGDPFISPLYPQVFPHVDETQVADRLRAPIYPKPEGVSQMAAALSSMDRVEVKMEDMES